MIGLRISAPDASIGEPEQDANSALTELDKGLRSTKLGEQCEAIVRFPRLFEKYPFPILINSSFLKLADVFRIGNNFLKVWVLRVCQQSEKHLDKILNVDEFLRRIFSVTHSNDPLARALTLRTLGAVAGIIPERQNVHHAIRRGLDSQDNVEVDAAIYATTRFAAHSSTFAVSMCNKLSDMVESENTHPDRTDKVVHALRTVHGGAIRAGGVLTLLHSLMERYPSASFVRSSISAITAISVDTVVHVPDQVEVLLTLTSTDPRWSVRRASLLGLRALAAHASLWREASLNALVERARDHADNAAHTHLCLQVMQRLVKCPAVCVAGSNAIRQFCYETTLSPRLDIASAAATVLAAIHVHCYEEGGVDIDSSDEILALQALVIAAAQSNDAEGLQSLQIALKSLIQLTLAASPTAYLTQTSTLLGSLLRKIPWSPDNIRVPGKKSKKGHGKLVCVLEALAALGGSAHCPASLRAAMPAVADALERCVQAGGRDTESEEDTESSDTALVLLCTVILQERAGSALEFRPAPAPADAPTAVPVWQQRVLQAAGTGTAWGKYRLARAALRYGHTSLAVILLKELKDIAPSEAAQRWLAALHRAAAADCKLEEEGIAGLEEASAEWEMAGDASGLGSCGGVGWWWVRARGAALSALGRAALAAHALCSQPPPAIAHAHSQSLGRGLWGGGGGGGACGAALSAAAAALAAAAAAHTQRHNTHFHADDSTLRHLDICHYTYSYLAQFIESLVNAKAPSVMLSMEGHQGIPGGKIRTLEDKIMWSAVEELQRIAPLCPPATTHITHQHARAVRLCVSAASRRTVWPLAVWCPRNDEPLCRLSVTPTSRTSEPAATLPVSHHLAVHIEGLIKTPSRLKKNQEERQVKHVQLTVTVTPHPRSNEKTVDLTNVQPISTAVQTVTPVRDFFSGQQLVTVPAAGLYTVGVQAACVDQLGNLWLSNHSTNTLIKAHEDATCKGNTQTSRGRF